MRYFCNYKQKKRSQNLTTGFTLVESFVAVAVLMVIIMGPMVLAEQSIKQAIYAKDQVTAYYLAEEAVEYIRNIRDANRLKGQNWLQGLSECTSGPSDYCGIDSTAAQVGDQIVTCSNHNNCLLSFNPNTGFYGHQLGAPWQDSIFTRKVIIVSTDGSSIIGTEKEVIIKVNLSWQTENLPLKSFEIRENLMDI